MVVWPCPWTCCAIRRMHYTVIPWGFWSALLMRLLQVYIPVNTCSCDHLDCGSVGVTSSRTDQTVPHVAKNGSLFSFIYVFAVKFSLWLFNALAGHAS